ncbi:hypothetical protein ACRN9C_09995 [Shewanella frigidimarina]|uniref:hypothetical protein n=1 Tax=Shewanella frigidimarina TaxID=56812 RepID=UPI003D7A1C39
MMKDENDNKTVDYIENDIVHCQLCNKDITNDTFAFVMAEYCDKCFYTKDNGSNDLSLTISLASAVAHSGLGKADLRLFLTIVIRIAEEEPKAIFELNQSHMAKKYRLKQSNISRSLKKLIEHKLIIKLDDNKYKLGISR